MTVLKKIILLIVLWRIILLVPLFIAHTRLPYNQTNKDMQLWAYTSPYKPVDSIYLYPWANFDGVHYLTIAGDGYYRGAVGRFFPLYPLLIHLGSRILGNTVIFGITEFLVALTISHLSLFGCVLVLYKLVRLDYSESTAVWSILFLLLFPTSFVFVGVYTESLFLLLSLLCLYSLRKGNLVIATLCACLLTLTRVVGVTISLAIAYWVITNSKLRRFTATKTTFAVALPLVCVFGTLAGWMYFNYLRWHDPLYFIHAQQAAADGRAGLVLFPQTMYRYFKILTTVPFTQLDWHFALLELSSFVLAVSLLFYAWKKKMNGVYLAFSIGCLAIPAISGTFASVPRYICIIFPVYIVLASIKDWRIKSGLLIFFAIVQWILLILFARGYFVV